MQFVVEPVIMQIRVSGVGLVRVGEPYPGEIKPEETPDQIEMKRVIAITYEPGIMDGDEVTDGEYHCWVGPQFLGLSQSIRATFEKGKEHNVQFSPENIQQLAECEAAVSRLDAVGCHSVKSRYVVEVQRIVPVATACAELYDYYAGLMGVGDDGEDDDDVTEESKPRAAQPVAANGA